MDNVVALNCKQFAAMSTQRLAYVACYLLSCSVAFTPLALHIIDI